MWHNYQADFKRSPFRSLHTQEICLFIHSEGPTLNSYHTYKHIFIFLQTTEQFPFTLLCEIQRSSAEANAVDTKGGQTFHYAVAGQIRTVDIFLEDLKRQFQKQPFSLHVHSGATVRETKSESMCFLHCQALLKFQNRPLKEYKNRKITIVLISVYRIHILSA